jgi:DNA-binding transcriptional regulator LsrR (DeoR family)
MTAWRLSFDAAELERAAAIARRHYLDGASKSELANEFGITRARVARIIAAAKDHGLIRIVINTPPEVDARLSEQLRSAFELDHAIVMNVPDDDVLIRNRLGQTAAEFLAEVVAEEDVLGVALGRTLWAMSGYLTRIERCTVVSLTGVLANANLTQSSLEILHRVSAASGGQMYPVYAPWVVSDAATAQLFREQPEVAQALARHCDVTTAVVAIGSWNPPNSTLADALDPVERESLTEQGVRAEVAGVLLDERGRSLTTGVTERLIGIEAGILRNIPHVIAVAGGRTKWRAIQATMQSNVVRSLITDAGTARFLLNDHFSSTAAPTTGHR